MRRAALIALMLAGCGRKPGHIENLYGSAVNIDVLRKPDKVEAFRLRHPKTQAEYSSNYNQWPVAAGPINVDATISAELAKLLLEEKTFCLWDEGKGCKPSPGLMLRFSDTRQIDLAFCFECDILYTYRGSQALGSANFDYSHNLLLKFFIALFPSDPDLPKLLRK